MECEHFEKFSMTGTNLNLERRDVIRCTEEIDHIQNGDLFPEGQRGDGRQLVEHVFWRGPDKAAHATVLVQHKVVEGWKVDAIENREIGCAEEVYG